MSQPPPPYSVTDGSCYPPPQEPGAVYPPPAPGAQPGGAYPPPPGAYPPPPGAAAAAPPSGGAYPQKDASGYLVTTSTTTTIKSQPQQKSGGGGLFGGLNKLMKDVEHGIGTVTRDASNVISKTTQGNLVETHFRSGNVVQLASRLNARCLAIVMGPAGQLMVDCNGNKSPQSFNCNWTVYRENPSSDVVRLYNQDNYLSVAGGVISLVKATSPQVAPATTRMKIYQSGHAVTVQPMLEAAVRLGVLATGEVRLMPQSGTGIPAALFEVLLVHMA